MKFPEDDNVIAQTQVPYTYEFESHLLEVDEKTFTASLVLPADTEVLDVVFNNDVKGIIALVKHAETGSFIGTDLNKLKFNFIFIGINWKVDGDIVDRSDKICTLTIPSGCGIGFASTYHIYVNYETLVEDNEITQEIVKEVETTA